MDKVHHKYSEREAMLNDLVKAEIGKDDECKTFAGVADALSTYCSARTSEVGSLPGSLEDQRKRLTSMADELKEKESDVNDLERISATLRGKGVVENVYTSHSASSCRAGWTSLSSLCVTVPAFAIRGAFHLHSLL